MFSEYFVFLYQLRFPFCIESYLYLVVRFSFSNGVFLPCDHGLDFDISLLGGNSFNQCINQPAIFFCIK